jgi:hypothetical protein
MTTITARRLVMSAGQVAGMCARLRLTPPPAFDVAAEEVDEVQPAVAVGLAAVCVPSVAVHVASSYGDSVLGVRGDLGGGLVRGSSHDVEMSAWPAVRLGHEIARTVPRLGSVDRPELHLPLDEAPVALGEVTVGYLRATVVAPPQVVGVVIWVATPGGWFFLEPAEVIRGVRWARVRPVAPGDLGAAVAPFLAAALA